MPYAKARRYPIRRRRSYGRRATKARTKAVGRPSTRRTVAIPRSPFRSKWKNPLSAGALIKFKYADTDFDMSTSIGSGYYTKNVFAGNSLFDPDQTGVGVQPYGFDPMSSLFGAYHVSASKIKVRFYTTESNVYKVVCTVVPHQDNALDYYDPSDLRVISGAKQHIISSTEGITRGHFIQSYCTTARMFRGTTSKDADFSALVTSNPTRMWYWHVYVDTTDTASEDSVSMDVQITYYATMRKTTNNNES